MSLMVSARGAICSSGAGRPRERDSTTGLYGAGRYHAAGRSCPGDSRLNSVRIELFLHVIIVIIALGVTFVYPILQGFAERKGVGATRFALEFMRRLETIVVIPGAVLLFIFGGLLVGNSNLPYKDDMPTWLIVSIVWFLVAFAVAVFVQRRNVSKALKALEGVPESKELPAYYVAIGKRMQMVGGLLGLSIVGIAFLMVWKPGQ
ncbi:MAG: DUF2269 family protein [Tepidiformaceae bacterium]